MKRLWLILLSLGLIAVFSTQAMAVDVKFSGEFYAAGLYLDKTTLNKNSWMDQQETIHNPGPSTAFYFQRLRLNTEFILSPGLMLSTRADIMERAWGASRSAPGTGLDTLSAGTRAENENIAFDLAYVSYLSPIGLFQVGYMVDEVWGTVFGDNSIPQGKILFGTQVGPLSLEVDMGKNSYTAALNGIGGEQSYPRGSFSALNSASDADSSFYTAAVLYNWKSGEAGFLFRYMRVATTRPIINATTNLYNLQPYAKAKIGPVAIQTELWHMFGQWKWEEDRDDTRVEQWAGWVDATADLGMFYVGGTFAYVSGQDPGTSASTGGLLDGGIDWKPCLILFNSDLSYWAGAQAGYNASPSIIPSVPPMHPYGINAGPMINAWFFQARGGVRPIDKLDISASISFANADKKPTANWVYNDYGYEVDLTATYKITNNLSYMLGGGYLFTGKYFKGESDANEVTNNFMIINKLTLTF